MQTNPFDGIELLTHVDNVINYPSIVPDIVNLVT